MREGKWEWEKSKVLNFAIEEPCGYPRRWCQPGICRRKRLGDRVHERDILPLHHSLAATAAQDGPEGHAASALGNLDRRLQAARYEVAALRGRALHL